MLKLNLANKASSDISFELVSFPDGQQDLRIIGWGDKELGFWVENYRDTLWRVEILSRFNSFRDLELIICAVKALRKIGFQKIDLNIPYLLGARSDRQFVAGGTSYLVEVVAPIINSLGFDRVMTLDAHSDVAAACIPNLLSACNSHVVEEFFKSYLVEGEYYLVAPDGGALKKIYKTAEAIGYKGKILVCMKHRDEATGKITSTEVILPDDYNPEATLVIVDDICDGGRTFVEISKAARKQGHTGKIYLVVSHGIFSAGYEELNAHLDGVFCTDSVKEVEEQWFDGYHFQPTGVKQVKMFE